VIVTDAWFPQVNGVVRCLEALGRRELGAMGHEVDYLTPQGFWTCPLPDLSRDSAVAGDRRRRSRRRSPGALPTMFTQLPPKGRLGLARTGSSRWSRGSGSPHLLVSHALPEYLAARVPVPTELGLWSSCAGSTPPAAADPGADTVARREGLAGRGFGHLVTWTRGVDHRNAWRRGQRRRSARCLGHICFMSAAFR